jgi:hypothetical protein
MGSIFSSVVPYERTFVTDEGTNEAREGRKDRHIHHTCEKSSWCTQLL